jgi:hypothetical protein
MQGPISGRGISLGERVQYDKDKRAWNGDESTPMFARDPVRSCNFPFMKVEESREKTNIPPHPEKKSFHLMNHVN